MKRPSFKVLVFSAIFVCIAVYLVSQSAVSWQPGFGQLRGAYAVRSYLEKNQQIGIKEDDSETVSLSNLEACPTPYRGTECSIKLVGFKERSTPRHSGFITVNQRRLSDWNNTTGIVLFRIGYACELNETVKFDVDNVEGLVKYMTAQARDTLLVAVSGDYNVLENRVVQTKLKTVGAWFNGIVRDCSYGFLFKIGYRGLTESWKGCPRQGNFSFSKTITQGSPLSVDFTEPSEEELEQKYTEVKLGGHWRPPNCKAHSKIAIIIPFRDRHPHLRSLLNYMLPFLMKQNLDFTFYIIEQAGNTIFNRAQLMNIGYLEAKQRENYDCYIFHDVDVFPEDMCNIYACADQPRHFIVGFSTEGYVKPYETEFGGVTGLTSAHIEAINGFSNVFFAWGGEDDEIAFRIVTKGMKIMRYPREIGKYKMITHKRDKTNPSSGRRKVNMQGHARSYMSVDGLNSLQYEKLSVETKPLYTHITVQIEGPSLSKDVQDFYLKATDKFKTLLKKG